MKCKEAKKLESNTHISYIVLTDALNNQYLAHNLHLASPTLSKCIFTPEEIKERMEKRKKKFRPYVQKDSREQYKKV